MSGSRGQEPLPGSWPRVRVHPGTGVVDRRGDVLLVVPVLPATQVQALREVLDLCRRPDPAGAARIDALRGLLGLRPAADTPGFALLIRTGGSFRALLHGRVRLLVDGRAHGQPAPPAGGKPSECILEDGTWHGATITADGHPADEGAAGPDLGGVLSFDLERGTVPGGGVTLLPARESRAVDSPAAPATGTSATALRPVVRFRSVLLGECAVQASGGPPAGGPARPPLPIAGRRGEGAVGTPATGPGIVVDGVHCPAGHFTDPERSTCLTCGRACPPDGPRLRLPRPPLGILVTDGGTVYPVTGDYVIGREAGEAPDVLAGRARALPLRDAERSTSRVHARLTVSGWKALLSDERSANGTWLSRSGAAGPWLPVTAQVPVALLHGDRVRLGKRQLLFDTWRETVVPQAFR